MFLCLVAQGDISHKDCFTAEQAMVGADSATLGPSSTARGYAHACLVDGIVHLASAALSDTGQAPFGLLLPAYYRVYRSHCGFLSSDYLNLGHHGILCTWH
jgi:hypothetical protein